MPNLSTLPELRRALAATALLSLALGSGGGCVGCAGEGDPITQGTGGQAGGSITGTAGAPMIPLPPTDLPPEKACSGDSPGHAPSMRSRPLCDEWPPPQVVLVIADRS